MLNETPENKAPGIVAEGKGDMRKGDLY